MIIFNGNIGRIKDGTILNYKNQIKGKKQKDLENLMKIELIQLKFNNGNSYKYKPFKYCCKTIQQNKAIDFMDEDLVYIDDYLDDERWIPQFCTLHREIMDSDELEIDKNYPIQFCPHCGEKIDIKIIDKIDVSEKYNELSKLCDKLQQKSRETDSKKEEYELRKQIRNLNDQINDLYELGEWKENLLL